MSLNNLIHEFVILINEILIFENHKEITFIPSLTNSGLMVALRNTDDASGASLRMSCSFSAMLEFALIRLETRTPAEAENQNFR